jgi:hypothetical protein
MTRTEFLRNLLKPGVGEVNTLPVWLDKNAIAEHDTIILNDGHFTAEEAVVIAQKLPRVEVLWRPLGKK